MKIGIVGLPNVGKSTLFNALTKKKVDIANYPFCTIEPNVGIVEVRDARLEELADFSSSKKMVPAVVEFVDIAGLVKGAAEGEGLGNAFLSHIKEVDVIAEVLRVFEDENVTHVSGAPHPSSDKGVVEYELILKDLETVSKRLDSLQREVKAGTKEAVAEHMVMQRIESALKSGERAAHVELSEDDILFVKPLQLLTIKPIIYIFNVSEDELASGWKPDASMVEELGASEWVVISANIESEIALLSAEERTEYMQSFGLHESGLDQLVSVGYKTLGLMTFFTTGESETRGWTVPIDSSAPRAGRAIHSDFEEKFIRAEIIQWDKLFEAGSHAAARERGWIRTEGKDYVVQDGDVIEFKI